MLQVIIIIIITIIPGGDIGCQIMPLQTVFVS